jgi:Fibronectin type III domain
MQAVIVTSTSAVLKWTPPDDNGSRISEYILEKATALNGQPTSVFTLQYRGNGCEAHCENLESGTAYLFRLAAYSEVCSVLLARLKYTAKNVL